ncbi:MAG: hypothetical protein L0387_35940 [Acidobacteria bacterium]|nr:hypothetical protein [Acidobacteriota bacterium]MCI0718688.1 hypothetical protein [Acidobacteriota bacterium]
MVLKRFGVMSCAKVAGTLYGVMGILFGGTFALVSTLGLALGQGDSSQAPAWFGPLFGVGAIVLFPLLYGIMGFIGGLITAALYNLLAGFVGGIEVELQ